MAATASAMRVRTHSLQAAFNRNHISVCITRLREAIIPMGVMIYNKVITATTEVQEHLRSSMWPVAGKIVIPKFLYWIKWDFNRM